MTDKKAKKLSREDRLAANLRANLKRRKSVARKAAGKNPNTDKSAS